MDSAKNVGRIISFKKFGMVKVNIYMYNPLFAWDKRFYLEFCTHNFKKKVKGLEFYYCSNIDFLLLKCVENSNKVMFHIYFTVLLFCIFTVLQKKS